jgi:hypothetical protein
MRGQQSHPIAINSKPGRRDQWACSAPELHELLLVRLFIGQELGGARQRQPQFDSLVQMSVNVRQTQV